MKIAHIINPVKVEPTSDLYLAQPITFETMRRAKAFAHDGIEVELYTTQYAEDREILPEGFTILPDLERSILDIAHSDIQRKLPLLTDILQRLYDASQAEYLIYTNVDIALMPHFYFSVASLLKKHGALVINRRTIANRYESTVDLALMYSDIGDKHRGYDCFVFRRDMFPKMQLGNVCVGAPYVGKILYANVAAFSKSVLEMKDSHLTFHIGNDRIWASDKHRVYAEYNAREMQAALLQLREHSGPFNNTTAVGQFLLDQYVVRKIDALKPVLQLDNTSDIFATSSRTKSLVRRLLTALKYRTKRLFSQLLLV
jgi:hypothetical protein